MFSVLRWARIIAKTVFGQRQENGSLTILTKVKKRRLIFS
nr:MAG TPA: hypothetical protein [Caudoviricetes sp.]